MQLSLARRAWIHPEEFAAEWLDRPGSTAFSPLLLTAALGAGLYSAGVRLVDGPHATALFGAAGTLAPLLLWIGAVPALFILGSHLGSRMRLRQVMLVSLTALSFGGFALAASLPVEWLLDYALPASKSRLLLHGSVLLAAGLCTFDVLHRVLKQLEDSRPARALWLGLLVLSWLQLAVVVVPRTGGA